jgi:hypothetical protein
MRPLKSSVADPEPQGSAPFRRIRNFGYRIRIRRIRNFGYPDPADPDPDPRLQNWHLINLFSVERYCE